jgi:hypothetical protein
MITEKDFECVDCGIHTFDIKEDYMVDWDLWERVGAGRGMLCIGCLEARLGRELTPADFINAPINTPAFKKSKRLAQRLGHPSDPPTT